MTVIRWKDEAIKSDTAYSLEAIEVQEEAANASEGYYTPTLAAHAATGDTENLAQFKAGVKPEHRFNHCKEIAFEVKAVERGGNRTGGRGNGG